MRLVGICDFDFGQAFPVVQMQLQTISVETNTKTVTVFTLNIEVTISMHNLQKRERRFTKNDESVTSSNQIGRN